MAALSQEAQGELPNDSSQKTKQQQQEQHPISGKQQPSDRSERSPTLARIFIHAFLPSALCFLFYLSLVRPPASTKSKSRLQH